MRRYLRPRRPVVLTGVTRRVAAAGAWTFARMAERYGRCATSSPRRSTNGTLLDDARRRRVPRIALREFIASLATPATASHYVMAPTWNLPRGVPATTTACRAYCAGAPHLRAKVWLGKAGTVTPMHRDVPHNLHVHLTGRKRWLLFPPGERRACIRAGFSPACRTSPQVDPEHPDYDRYPRFRGATALGATVGPRRDALHPARLVAPHALARRRRGDELLVGRAVVRLASLASTAFKRLRGIRRDEWA